MSQKLLDTFLIKNTQYIFALVVLTVTVLASHSVNIHLVPHICVFWTKSLK